MSQKGWSCFQDTLLLQAYEKHAEKWQFISTAFPGKSALECAARYKTLSERGITLSNYQFQIRKDLKNVKKSISIVKSAPLLEKVKTANHAPYSSPLQKQPLSNLPVKTEPIESFLDFFNSENSKIQSFTSPLQTCVNEEASDLLVGPDEEIEKRHEFSSIKIPRSEVDDLFQETVEMMADEEKRIIPSCTTVEPNWAFSKKQKFSVEQLNAVQNQLNSFFQLTVQTYSIIKETHGQLNSKTEYWKKELKELMDLSEWGKCATGENSLFNIKGLNLLPKIFSIPSDSALQDSIDFKYNLKIAVQPKVKSRFLEAKESPTNSTKKRTKHLKSVQLTESIKNTLNVFSGIFDTKLIPEIIPVVESDIYDFSTLEIELFYLGLLSFGFSDFASVRAFYLPTKTATQIRRKFQNVKYRKASKGMEKIKTLWLQPFKPLLVTERELIVEGYRKFGKRFRVTVRTFFGTYPTTLLKQVWDELYLLGEIDVTWLNLRSTDAGTQNKGAHGSRPTRKSPRKGIYVNANLLSLPPLLIRTPIESNVSPFSTPIHSSHISNQVQTSIRKESNQLPYPTSAFHQHQNESHSFLQEIFTDTGSLYNPTSEWDPIFTNTAESTDQIDNINYNDFLESIFEPEMHDTEEKENIFLYPDNTDQAESRPLISLSGAYHYDSSDEEQPKAQPHQVTSANTINNVNNINSIVDNEIESFFKTNQETLPFISPDRRITRAASRIVTANNSASKDRNSPKQHPSKFAKKGPRKSLISEFTNEKIITKKRISYNQDATNSDIVSKKQCLESLEGHFFNSEGTYS